VVPLSRRVYLWLVWLFLGAVVIQVFTIGLQLFAGVSADVHIGFGFVVLLLSILVAIGAVVAGLPGRSKRWAGALFAITILQVILAGISHGGATPISAFHPVNALLLFWITLRVIRDAQEQAAMSKPAAPPEGAPAEAPSS